MNTEDKDYVLFAVEVKVPRELLTDGYLSREQIAWIACQDAMGSVREFVREWKP